jgi:serine beta-lactamase-like protein LACTB, mitochondrial
MKKISFLISICFVVGTSLYGQKNVYESVINNSKNSIEEIINGSKVPGLAITLSIKDSIVWSEGFGYADLENRVTVIPSQTKFRVASISKSFTSIALGILLEKNRIDLDVPIQQYVPNFPEKKYPITIRQIGGHLAGIRTYNDNEYHIAKKYKNLNDGLSIFMNDSLLVKPNTEFLYSNYGWNLIGVAIENVSKTNFVTFMNEYVFLPLKMNSTVPDYNDSIVPYRSRFYVKDSSGKIINAPYVDNSFKWPAGGYLSTTLDLMNFGRQLIIPEIINSTTFKILATNQKTSSGSYIDYGIGWMVGNVTDSVSYFGHTSTAVGGKSFLIVIPKYEIVFALAANTDDIDFGPDYQKILTILKQLIAIQNSKSY